MPIRTLGRQGLALLFAALISGCSSILPWPGSSSSRASAECRWSRSSCLYDGKYEPGESDYAEQEAKRLNQSELERLRRATDN